MNKGLWQKLWLARSRIGWTFFSILVVALSAVLAASEKWMSEDGSEIRVFSGLMFLAELVGILSLPIFLAVLLLFKGPLIWRFLKWAFSWRMIRRCLYGAASFTLLVLLFYAEEDWRGRRDWEQFKRTWEAKGERFDFASFVPPAVPDDQNFAFTPLVANSCIHYLDRLQNGTEQPNTNDPRRLDVHINARYDWKPWPTNGFSLGSWQCGKKADLKVLQSYYRAPVITNWTDKRLSRGQAVQVRIDMKRDKSLLNATNEFPVAPQAQSPAADVLLALSKYDGEVEELRQASRLPYSRLPIHHELGPTNERLYVVTAPLKECANYLGLRAIAELENGQEENAMGDAKLILYLANSIRDQPLHCQLARISMIDCALQPLWEGLVDRHWSDAQLISIDDDLADSDFLSDYQLAVRLYRAWLIEELNEEERNRRFHQYYAEAVSDGLGLWDRLFCASKACLTPKGWFYQNDIALAEMLQKSLRTDAEVNRRILGREVAWRNAAARVINFANSSPYNCIAGEVCPYFSIYAEKFAFAQSSLDRARVACALERYRLAHGEFPATLDALSPKFIAKLPHDIINGEPLHYRRKDAGHFLLYSVGWNGTDDGGIVVRKENLNRAVPDLEKGDWVWPDSAQ